MTDTEIQQSAEEAYPLGWPKTHTQQKYNQAAFIRGVKSDAAARHHAKEWLPVTELKPDNQRYVLVIAPECKVIGNVLIGCYFKPERDYSEAWTVYDFNESKLDATVTHWMELPPINIAGAMNVANGA